MGFLIILITVLLFQILSRAKPALGGNPISQSSVGKKALPKLEDFLKKRDFTGAITLLEVPLEFAKGV